MYLTFRYRFRICRHLTVEIIQKLLFVGILSRDFTLGINK